MVSSGRTSAREASTPEGVRVVEDGPDGGVATYRSPVPDARVLIEWRWYRRSLYPLMGIFLAGDALFFYGGASMWRRHVEIHDVASVLMPILAFVAMSYGLICMFLNRTQVIVRGGMMSIRHRPFPWLGGKRLPVNHLRKLFFRVESGRATQYHLAAELDDGRRVALMTAPQHVLVYIKSFLEKRLSLPDEARRGTE